MLKTLKFHRNEDREVYVTSDWHLGHDRDFIWGKRGYLDVHDHRQQVIEGINRARPNDVIINCGDVTLNTNEDQFEDYFSRIDCDNIYLLWGNHNAPSERIYRRAIFKRYGEDIEVYPFRYKNIIFVGNYLEFVVNNQMIIAGHYPIHEFNHMKHSSWHICGHSHYGNPLTHADNFEGKRLDVGWEAFRKMLSFTELKDVMDKKSVAKISHH